METLSRYHLIWSAEQKEKQEKENSTRSYISWKILRPGNYASHNDLTGPLWRVSSFSEIIYYLVNCENITDINAWHSNFPFNKNWQDCGVDLFYKL